MREAPLALTERTLLHLRRTVGLHQRLVADGAVAERDLDTLRKGTWMTLLGFTEFYADQVLELLFQRAMRNAGEGARYLLRNEEAKAYSNWDARRDAFSGVFSVPVGRFSSWDRFDAAIWVRNSIAHGAGGLTRLQKRSEAVKAVLVSGLVQDDFLILTEDSLAACGIACTAFVEELDSAARSSMVSD